MALSSMIRRACASAIPLSRCATASYRSRNFHSAISAIVRVEKQQQLQGRLLLPLWRFSTATSLKDTADSTLLRVLESELDCAPQPADVNELIPNGFPFQIHDNPGERTILLERKYQDEIIKVEVDMPSDLDEDGEDDDEGQDENTDESAFKSSLPLVVSITKGNGQCLEFGITAFADEISIDTLSIKNPDTSEDQLAYEGPDFGDLDENLQKAFYKYLEIRGIKPSTTNFLFEYMTNKDNKEYSKWLENLKNFLEK